MKNKFPGGAKPPQTPPRFVEQNFGRYRALNFNFFFWFGANLGRFRCENLGRFRGENLGRFCGENLGRFRGENLGRFRGENLSLQSLRSIA